MNLIVYGSALLVWMIAAPSPPASFETQAPSFGVKAIHVAPLRADVYQEWSEPAANFAIRLDTMTIRHRVAAISMLPGQEVRISLQDAEGDVDLVLEADDAQLLERNGERYWKAPAEPGVAAFRMVNRGGETQRDTITVHAFVRRPMTELVDEVLDGYRIGRYRSRPSTWRREYEPPAGLLPVRPEDEDILVSPNFSLGQFLCKQPGNPRYLAHSRPLTLKLESILREVRSKGFDAPTLTVMSGYRTPWYNRSIGNKTDFSRHLWGDAADIYVDIDRNDDMDDLNQDGKVNRADALLLAQWIDALMGRRLPRIRPGGLATYRRNAVHGPFVHIDARGVRARW